MPPKARRLPDRITSVENVSIWMLPDDAKKFRNMSPRRRGLCIRIPDDIEAMSESTVKGIWNAKTQN